MRSSIYNSSPWYPRLTIAGGSIASPHYVQGNFKKFDVNRRKGGDGD